MTQHHEHDPNRGPQEHPTADDGIRPAEPTAMGPTIRTAEEATATTMPAAASADRPTPGPASHTSDWPGAPAPKRPAPRVRRTVAVAIAAGAAALGLLLGGTAGGVGGFLVGTAQPAQGTHAPDGDPGSPDSAPAVPMPDAEGAGGDAVGLVRDGGGRGLSTDVIRIAVGP